MRASTGELLAARFWAKVQYGDACWEWTGKRRRTKRQKGPGYGCIVVEGREQQAHRVSWTLTNGLIPTGRNVLHNCDNPPCVRPDHLFLGTQQDNIADMWAKGRARQGRPTPEQLRLNKATGDSHWSRRNPELVKRGAKHGMSKLNDEKVREIRRLHDEGHTDINLGKQFGVTEGTIHFIVKRQTWKHVE